MLTAQNPHPFQVGGSLPSHAATYVRRQADEVLFEGLLQGAFCYVFNARQMGKSSLRVQTAQRLQANGVRCAVLDMTIIGTREITSDQWYASMAALLVKAFRLEVSLLSWWRDRPHLSVTTRFSEFIDTVLLSQVAAPIALFIDEIDSVLSLPFSTDDFFALIRACYNRRAEDSRYQRLTFALFGVATPTDLITDPTRTPFNIGRAVELRGFQFAEAAPLLAGLASHIAEPELALHRILHWTGGQPFLTQKLCQLVVEHHKGLAVSTAQTAIDVLVQRHILHQWESQDEPEHLKTIRDRLLYSDQKAGRLLGLYQQVLLRAELEDAIAADDSPQQMDLILTGLVEKRAGGLYLKNPIYQEVFHFQWVCQQLANLRPYSQGLNTWVLSSYQDASRLLRGQALRDALQWSQNKSLSDVDYRYLAASQECDRQESQRLLEAERLKEIEARLYLERQRSLEQRHHLQRQRVLLSIVSFILVVAIALGLFAYEQYQRTAVSEVKAIALSSEALFASHKELDALLQGITAKERLPHLSQVDTALKQQVDAALWQTVLKIQESNRLYGHTAAVLAVDFSPDGEQIATASVDGTIKLWRPDGTLLATLKGHSAIVRSVKFSPDGTQLASGGDDKTIRLWRRNGAPIKTLHSQASGIWSLDYSTDGAILISGGTDSSVEVWSAGGDRLTTFPGKKSGIRSVALSPDGQTIATGNTDNTVTLWSRDGSQRRVLEGHRTAVQAVTFSPDGQILVSASADGVINLWTHDGDLIKSFQGHDTGIWNLDFSPTGAMFASASRDKSIKLWRPDGVLITTLRGHDAAVWGVAFSPDGKAIASAGAESTTLLWRSESVFQRAIHGVTDITLKLLVLPGGEAIATVGNDKTIRFWNLDGTPLRTINAHDAATGRIDLSPDGKTLVSVSEDKTLKLWQLDGTLLRVFRDATATLISVDWHPHQQRLAASAADGKLWFWQPDGTLIQPIQAHTAPIWDLKFSPDGTLLASASNDTTAKLWKADGTPIKTLTGHQSAVWRVAFSPDSQQLATASGDATVKLWNRDGQLIKTLKGHQAAVWGIAFSPDGSLIATASIDETIKLWHSDGTLLTTLEGHQAGVREVTFHPQRPLLLSAGDDQTIMVWNLDQILSVEPLTYACQWVKNYLAHNGNLEQKQLCVHSK